LLGAVVGGWLQSELFRLYPLYTLPFTSTHGLITVPAFYVHDLSFVILFLS